MNNSSFTTPVPGPSVSCVPSEPVSIQLQVAMFILLVIFSLIGNSLVILVVAKNKRMHTVTNALITNMSVADILITILPMVWEIVRVIHLPKGNWPLGGFMCTFMHMCIYLSVACSILSLQVITCDRFLAIMFPFKSTIKKKMLPYILVSIWIISVAYASPTIYAMELAEFAGDTYCIEKWNPPFDAKNSPVHYTIILFVGLYALPLLTMAVMYTAIAWKLWKRIIPGESTSETEKHLLKQKKNVIKMLLAITLSFAICWLPVFVMQFIVFTSEYYQKCFTSFPRWFVFFAFFMQYLASAINPYIYFTFSGSYRRGLKNLVTCFKRIEPKSTVTTRTVQRNTCNRAKTQDGLPMTGKGDGIIREASADNLASLDRNANIAV